MTVLEKIKRCVSLVWDFQEFYGDEDIEDFCSNELDKYSQYNEILDYFKRIAELEKENAELKEKYVKNITDCDICDTYCNSQLTKAREIILRLYNAGRDVLMCRAEEKAYDNLSNAINDKSIEQFLNEVENV